VSEKPNSRFADGCHRWGWLIAIVSQLIAVAFLFGEMSGRIDAIQKQLDRLERSIEGPHYRGIQ